MSDELKKEKIDPANKKAADPVRSGILLLDIFLVLGEAIASFFSKLFGEATKTADSAEKLVKSQEAVEKTLDTLDDQALDTLLTEKQQVEVKDDLKNLTQPEAPSTTDHRPPHDDEGGTPVATAEAKLAEAFENLTQKQQELKNAEAAVKEFSTSFDGEERLAAVKIADEAVVEARNALTDAKQQVKVAKQELSAATVAEVKQGAPTEKSIEKNIEKLEGLKSTQDADLHAELKRLDTLAKAAEKGATSQTPTSSTAAPQRAGASSTAKAAPTPQQPKTSGTVKSGTTSTQPKITTEKTPGQKMLKAALQSVHAGLPNAQKELERAKKVRLGEIQKARMTKGLDGLKKTLKQVKSISATNPNWVKTSTPGVTKPTASQSSKP